MWLWTLSTASPTVNGNGSTKEDTEEEPDGDDDEGAKPAQTSGFVLEFDAARKIAQGLGIHLDKSPSIVEVKGDKARLLPVAERQNTSSAKKRLTLRPRRRSPRKRTPSSRSSRCSRRPTPT